MAVLTTSNCSAFFSPSESRACLHVMCACHVVVVQGSQFKIIFKQSLRSYCVEHAASNENGSELQKWENSKARDFKGKMWAIMSFYLSLNSSLTRMLCWWCVGGKEAHSSIIYSRRYSRAASHYMFHYYCCDKFFISGWGTWVRLLLILLMKKSPLFLFFYVPR